MPDHPLDSASSLVVEVASFDDGIATGTERDTRQVVRFVPSARTAERVRLALSEQRGITVGVEQDSPSVLAVEPA